MHKVYFKACDLRHVRTKSCDVSELTAAKTRTSSYLAKPLYREASGFASLVSEQVTASCQLQESVRSLLWNACCVCKIGHTLHPFSETIKSTVSWGDKKIKRKT